jgi:PAS domain S-box-containing protein
MVDIAKIGALVHNAPFPAWLATGKGDCVYANPALERLTGLNSEQINQADWRSFLQQEDRAAATASWQRSLAAGTPYRVRVRMRGVDSPHKTVELIAFGLKADDGTELWLFVGSHVGAPTHQGPTLETELQANLNLMPAPSWYSLPSGALTFVNERTADYLGLDRDHPLRFGIDTGASWDSHIPFLHPDDHEETRRIWSTCLRTGCAGEVRFRVRNAEGGYRWFLSRAEPLRASDGTLLYWIGVNLDVDDVTRAEDDLRKSEKELRDVIDTIPTLAWCNRPDGPNEFLNKAWHEYTGLSPEDSHGWGWQVAFHPEDLPPLTKRWQELLISGEPGEIEARLRRHDGVYRWFLIRVQPFRDATGNIVRWYGTSTDIEDRKRAEEALQLTSNDLQESKARLEEAQRITHVGYWERDLVTSRITWSDETYRIFGLQPQEHPVDLNTLRQKVHPEDWEFVSRALNDALAGGPRYNVEYRILRPTSELRAVHSEGDVKRDASGRPYQMFGTVQDITGRKRAEEDLQRTQFYLSEGQRLARMGSWAFNPSGFFEYWSPELFKICGLDPQKGAPTLEEYLATLHPQDQESMAETIKTMHADRCGCDVKKRIVRPDGELRYVRCVGIPVVEGEVLKGFLGTAMDVTEQELLTQELGRQQAYLTEAQRLTHTGSWAWNVSDRKTVHASEEWYRIFGFDPAGGASTWEKRLERIHPDDRLHWKSTVESAIAEKADFDVIFRIVLPEGMVRWVHTVGHPVLTANGELVQFIGSSADITELKSAEQEHDKLRQLEADLAHIDRVSTLGEMAASLAHEIKQPIAAAITSANSCIEWLSHDPPNIERARATAARIDRYGRRAAEIIDRIRSFYKKSHSERELVDVNEIINEMLALLQGEATRFSIEMHTELAAELPKIAADRIQLQQVFMNLMLNAIEAMSDSGGEVRVRSQLRDGQLLFSVSDTGPGLPAGNVDQIFSAFFTTKPQGSGMGLAISRTIVESHGGRLWATANDGRGTTFHFTVPTEMQS